MQIPSDQVDALAKDPRVRFVEEDFAIQISASKPATITTTQVENLWHLDRIDSRQLSGMDGLYSYCDEGEGVPVYVIDSGIHSGHREFAGVTIDHHDIYAPNYVGSAVPCLPEDHYHGTAVASLIAGVNVGVASRVKLVDLKAYSCSGWSTVSNLIGAFNWIISDGAPLWNGPISGPNPRQIAKLRNWPVNPDRTKAGVVNLSGFSPGGIKGYATEPSYTSISVEAAVRDVVAAGNVVVTSANNYSSSCADHTPSVLGYMGDGVQGAPDLDAYGYVTTTNVPPSVITVGGTDSNDRRWQSERSSGVDSGSNSGPCISIWAPAAEILSARHSSKLPNGAWQYSNEAYGRNSGTSFAAPLVSGIAARYIEYYSRGNYGLPPTPRQVYDALTDWSTVFKSDGRSPLITNVVAPTGAQPRLRTLGDGSQVPIGLLYRTGECRRRLVQ